MKTCNTCTYYIAGRNRTDDVCNAPQHEKLDLVRGGTYKTMKFCDNIRSMAASDNFCGAEGRFWTPAVEMIEMGAA